MQIISPGVEVMWMESGISMLQRIEAAGRTAYKSEEKISRNSAAKFVSMIVGRGHLSVLEHVSVSARVVCDRGVSHEIVRHRIAGYTQESTRYCNYAGKRFSNELTFILPVFLEGYGEDSPLYVNWLDTMKHAEQTYLSMIEQGANPQEARAVLPHSLKTEIVMTMNLREWRHFFQLRATPEAHPDMQRIAGKLLSEFQSHVPVVFNDIEQREEMPNTA